MAREDSKEDCHRGEQAHNTSHGKWLQTRYNRQDTTANGGKGEETQEEYEKRIEGYAEAVKYFLDHPEVPLNSVVRAFVESIRKETESEEQSIKQSTLS